MGLLLMERNEWGQQTEKLKSIAQDAEEKLRRELAGHLLLVAEAEKREQSLKQALAAEKLCVYDVMYFVCVLLILFGSPPNCMEIIPT